MFGFCTFCMSKLSLSCTGLVLHNERLCEVKDCIHFDIYKPTYQGLKSSWGFCYLDSTQTKEFGNRSLCMHAWDWLAGCGQQWLMKAKINVEVVSRRWITSTRIYTTIQALRKS